MRHYQTIDDYHRMQGQRVNTRPLYTGRRYSAGFMLMTIIFVMYLIAGIIKFVL